MATIKSPTHPPLSKIACKMLKWNSMNLNSKMCSRSLLMFLLRSGTNTAKLVLLPHECRKITTRLWCILWGAKWVCTSTYLKMLFSRSQFPFSLTRKAIQINILIGSFPTSFFFIFVFSIHFTIQLMVNKICSWLYSNRRLLVSEATALPTEPQPLPQIYNFWVL